MMVQVDKEKILAAVTAALTNFSHEGQAERITDAVILALTPNEEERRAKEIAFLMAQIATCEQMAEDRDGRDPVGSRQFAWRAEELKRQLAKLQNGGDVE